MYWLQLIRWKNLVIVFLTQLLAWACVILPIKGYSNIPLLLSSEFFLLLSLSTVLIAAAGYIINDYFDIKIDIINRPEKLVLEKRIPLKFAIVMHSVLNVTALIMAAYVARAAGHYTLLTLQLACTILLWFYSTHFKKQFMIGNVVVAVLTALTIVTLMLYEPGLRALSAEAAFITTTANKIPNPVWVLGIYTCFAFTLTWMREIVKDMEDFKGDAQEGCITMPIQWGLLRSVRFTQTLGVIAIIPLIVGAVKLINANWIVLGIYTIVLLALPIIVWMYYLPKKATSVHYHTMSRWLKLIMLSGIGSLIIYYFQAHA